MRFKFRKKKNVKNKKKTYILSFLIFALVIGFLALGVKVYDYLSVPKYTSPKIETISSEKDVQATKPNDSKKQKVSLAFQDGKELEGTESINVTQSGKLPDRQPSKEKVAYLTFDDGPTSNVTPVVLDTLKKYNVKATFFVLGKMVEKHPDVLKRTYEEGHFIANHSYSHDYNYLYSTPENFISDIKKSESTIKKVLGEDINVDYIRFPGGGFYESRKAYREAAVKNGYYYVDWNCLNGDAEGGKKTHQQLVDSVINTSKGKNEIVILMHDSSSKMTTAESLGQVIEYLKSQGYKFDTLNNYY